jgi:hypothetical protein
MRRSALIIGSLFLACGASLALAAPASAAVGSSSDHPWNWCNNDGDYYGNYGHYGNYNPYYHRHHRHHHHH